MTGSDRAGPVTPRHVRLLAVAAAAATAALAVAAVRPALRADASAPHGPVEAGAITASAAYADSLGDATRAALDAWAAAGAAALERAPRIRPPYLETGRFTGEQPEAVGYRVELLRGERLIVSLSAPHGDPLPFLDVVGSAPAASVPGRVEYVADRDGPVLVRLQPRLRATGAYSVAFDRTAALAFPVAYERASLLSYFFDPRDGGARRHHGVDIGAPRGTPVVAAADGVAERVERSEAGGLVVWIREHATGRTHYYAHLDTQRVRSGARVKAGDTIGTVGATGNAHSSAPHLHFGVYADGKPLDPLFYLDAPEPAAPRADDDADADLVGARMRTRLAGAALRTLNRMQGEARPLPRHAELEIVAAAGRYYRVRAADGGEGFLAAWLLEPAQDADRPRNRLRR